MERDPDETAGLPEHEDDDARRADPDATGAGTADDADLPDYEQEPGEGQDTGTQELNP